jgi:hypothetical protein
MNTPPDCTLTTACFDLNKYNPCSRKFEDIKTAITPLLEVPCYLVIYTDEHCIDTIKQVRQSFQLEHLTKYIVTKIEDLPFYQYISMIQSNRENYWPTRDERTCSESHLLCCSKFNFVLDTIQTNPFQTSKFGWIDSFVGNNFSKICEEYTPGKLLHILNHSFENKFSIQVLASADKKFKVPENKREYYSIYRYIVCGCLFITNKDIGVKILNRLNELFVDTTKQGYGHGEEMLYLEVLDEFYHDIHKSYGDYGQILDNFFYPMRYYRYVYKFLIHQNLYDYSNHRECYDCAKELQYVIEQLGVKVDYDVYIAILVSRYKCSLIINPSESIHRIADIFAACKKDAGMQAEFDKYRDYYINLFKDCPLYNLRYQSL